MAGAAIRFRSRHIQLPSSTTTLNLILQLELESITLVLLDAATTLMSRPISTCASLDRSCMEHTPSLTHVLNYLLAPRPGRCKLARRVVQQAHQIIHMIGRPLVSILRLRLRLRFIVGLVSANQSQALGHVSPCSPPVILPHGPVTPFPCLIDRDGQYDDDMP